MEFDNEEKMLNHYIEIGAIDISGIGEDGEFIYAITPKAKVVAPDLWQAHMEHVDEILQELYKDGLIDVEYDENLEATFRLNDKGFEAIQKLGLFPMDTKDIPND